MELIEKNDTKSFDKYIEETGNTICGEFPIRILMHTIKNSKSYKNLETKFVQYDQSDKVKSFNGSSVSYAAGVTYIRWFCFLLFIIWFYEIQQLFNLWNDQFSFYKKGK